MQEQLYLTVRGMRYQILDMIRKRSIMDDGVLAVSRFTSNMKITLTMSNIAANEVRQQRVGQGILLFSKALFSKLSALAAKDPLHK